MRINLSRWQFESDTRICRCAYFSYLFATFRSTITDVSATIMHIAKGVMRSSAAPVDMLGGNPNINTDQAMDNMIIAEKSTRPVLREFSEYFSFFDNILHYCNVDSYFHVFGVDDYDLHRIMDHASMKHFTGTLRASIFEVFMFLTFVAARTVVIISCTH